MTLARRRGAHTRIHPPAQQHHRFSLVRPYHGSWPLPLCSVSLTSFTSFTSFASLSSNALGRGIPNKFVQLQPESYWQSIFQNPFHEHARLQPRPLPLRILERRRKQDLLHPSCQPMPGGIIAHEFII